MTMGEKHELKDTAIRVHIKHTKPVEVNEFVASLTSVNSLFSSFMKENADCKEEVQAKLYVEKIKEGSIDIWMVAPVLLGIIPFVDTTNKLCDFVRHINDFIAHFTRGLNPEKKYTLSELKDLKELFIPTSTDRGGEITIEAVDVKTSSVVERGTTVEFGSSNSIQNQIEREIEIRKNTETSDGVYKGVLMQIYQVRNNADSNIGNKAIIDEIYMGKKMPVYFEPAELKETIIHSENNPIKTGFVVDAAVMTVEGKPKAYKIIGLHESFPLEED